jgi:uncharacterized protein YoaH (UPF0181 family)
MGANGPIANIVSKVSNLPQQLASSFRGPLGDIIGKIAKPIQKLIGKFTDKVPNLEEMALGYIDKATPGLVGQAEEKIQELAAKGQEQLQGKLNEVAGQADGKINQTLDKIFSFQQKLPERVELMMSKGQSTIKLGLDKLAQMLRSKVAVQP